MTCDVFDLSVPHLRLVSLKIAPDIRPGHKTNVLPGYFVVLGYSNSDGRLMIRWSPNAALGQSSHHVRLPDTDDISADPVYGADTDQPMKLQDHGALVNQADPRYAYLMAEVEEPNPTHAV